MTGPITLTSGRSPPTACWPIRSISIILAKGYSQPRMAGKAGQRSIPGRSDRMTDRLQFDAHVRPRRSQQPFLYRRTAGTLSSTPANEPFYRSTNGGATWTADSQRSRRLHLRVRRGGSRAKLSGHLHRRICQQRLWRLAIHQQRPVVDQYRDIPDRRTRPDHRPSPAIPTITARSMSASPAADTPICPQPPQPGHQFSKRVVRPSPGSATSPATGDLNAGKTVALTLASARL